MLSLESAIAADSFVRVVDAFVDAIDLKSFGFIHVECMEEGRPPYYLEYNEQILDKSQIHNGLIINEAGMYTYLPICL